MQTYETPTASPTTSMNKNTATSFAMWFNSISYSQGTGAGSDSMALVPYTRTEIAKYKWNSDQAVSPEYLNEAKDTLKTVPKKMRDLFPEYDITAKLEERDRQETTLKSRVDKYINPWSYKNERSDVPSSNPFGLYTPNALSDIEHWLTELGKYDFYAFGQRDKSAQQEDYIRLLRSWNEYHVGFLETLNLSDKEARLEAVKEMGQNIFVKTELSFLSGKSLKDISPYDNPEQWMIFNALNILHSPEARISPIARFRAIELLAQYPVTDLQKIFFEDHKEYGGKGRFRPAFYYQQAFSKDILRLPPTFWRSNEDRAELLHKKWFQNQAVQDIFAKFVVKTSHWDRYDYGAVFNELLVKHPYEAVQVALLLLGDADTLGIDEAAGFAGLINLSKVDPVTRELMFGNGSYLNMHKAPKDMSQQIEHGMGLITLDDVLLDSQFEGLTKEEMLQVIRRQQIALRRLDSQLAETEAKMANGFFIATSRDILDKLDPKQYYKTLAVHPEYDPNDMDEAIRRQYQRLVRKYHPDTGETPNPKKFQEAQEAYDAIRSKELRASYGSR